MWSPCLGLSVKVCHLTYQIWRNPSLFFLHGFVPNLYFSARSSTSLMNSVTDFFPWGVCMSLSSAIHRWLTCAHPWFLLMTAWSESGIVPSVVTPALARQRNWCPSCRRSSFSFWVSFLMSLESASRLVWTYQSLKCSRFLQGSLLRSQGLPSVASPVSYHFSHLLPAWAG